MLQLNDEWHELCSFLEILDPIHRDGVVTQLELMDELPKVLIDSHIRRTTIISKDINFKKSYLKLLYKIRMAYFDKLCMLLFLFRRNLV